ncbi:MAG: biotin/lipoyl-containing protein [Verrucomicrobiia bacterium]
MPEPVLLPDLGEGIESGDVVKVLVKEGDHVEQNQTLLEIETDKAVAEVPAGKSGKVTKILVKSGDKIKVGSPLLEMDASEKENSPEKKLETLPKEKSKKEDKKEEKKEKIPKPSATKTQLQEVKLPSLGEGIEGGEIVKVLVKVGDAVEKDETLLEIETDKAVAEIPCPAQGKITKILVKEGDKIKVGSLLLEIQASIAEKSQEVEVPETPQKTKNEQSARKESQEKTDYFFLYNRWG